MLEAIAASVGGPDSSDPHSARAAAAAYWRRAWRSLLPLFLLFLLGPVTRAAAVPGAAELGSPAQEGRGAQLVRAEELRRQLHDYRQRWRSEAALPARTMPPLPVQTPPPTRARSPRLRLISGDGAGHAAVGADVLDPPVEAYWRLSDAERELLHRQLRQVARERPLPGDR